MELFGRRMMERLDEVVMWRYGEGLGDGYGYHGEEDEENDDDVVYPKVSSVGSGFLECFSSVSWNECDRVGPSPSMDGVPRPNLNGYRDEEDEENDDDVVYSESKQRGFWVFWNAPAALVGMDSDRSWTISFHARCVPRLNLNRPGEGSTP
ncbi:hypothetical protein AAG906_024565 [Vitis piasezkii]